MSKKQISHVIIHRVHSPDRCTRTSKISQFHFDIIERRLEQSQFSNSEKIAIIDGVISNLHARQSNEFIQ